MLETMLNNNTFVSLKILEALMQKNLTEEEKAKIIAEGFAELESRYPDLKYHATKDDVTKSTLELTKEIETTRKEIKELDLKLTKEIKELDLKLTKEIKEVDKKIESSKIITLKWTFVFWVTQMIALGSILYRVTK